jgi:pimeloyl-ACP methyl ester carboxylesterase
MLRGMTTQVYLVRPLALLALAAFSGCSHYATVREKEPTHRYKATTPVGQIIRAAILMPGRDPAAVLGGYLDAASAAAEVLKKSPRDRDALRDYNFAVARVFESIHDANLRPWAAPVVAMGKSGKWELSQAFERRPEIPADLFECLPADRYEFRGTYVKSHNVKNGLGAPLIIGSKENVEVTLFDPFAPGSHTYYGGTGLLRFNGRRAVLETLDPLAVETVKLGSHTFPLAADFTASLAYGLAKKDPKFFEIARLLRPQKYAESARLARLQSYDPKKIPVICVHGLMDSHATWTPMITALRTDPIVRANYQFWFYSYPSGYPYPFSAAIMRRQLDNIKKAYPSHKKAIVIGHSMGGLVSRTMITDSGMSIWNQYYSKPPEQIGFSDAARQVLTDSLIFKSRPDISRAIFIAAPHRGADMAANWIGKLGERLVKAPFTLLEIANETRKFVMLDPTVTTLNRIPNSVSTLSPENRFVKTINTLPIAKGIPYHSIIGDRGKGGNRDTSKPVSSDGFVPYWSSHLPGAESELIIPTNHSAHRSPQAIDEVRRILIKHVGKPKARR